MKFSQFNLTLNFTLYQHSSWRFQSTLLSEFQSINLGLKAAVFKKCKKGPYSTVVSNTNIPVHYQVYEFNLSVKV